MRPYSLRRVGILEETARDSDEGRTLTTSASFYTRAYSVSREGDAESQLTEHSTVQKTRGHRSVAFRLLNPKSTSASKARKRSGPDPLQVQQHGKRRAGTLAQ